MPITMPSTSPMAQPVRQCNVADAAMAHGGAGAVFGWVALVRP
ncbi:hypothetical protein SAMN05660350_04576 [Geodermatophilus obscurus]|uniref:Uncharacterized protein n=1 Tax=Geodermatophilus obscurus TaxID=1861 RepID=A0A1M7UZW8_9ACTN|nr:hypothetical protein SAMN05660350_04576 [Geodermatophilus obscurus]